MDKNIILVVFVFWPLTLMAVPGSLTISEPAEGAKPAKKFTPVPTPRGQLYYEQRCQLCHESTVHIRKDRHADSIAKIRQWVIRWSDHLKLNWSDEEISDVVNYLDQEYYKLKLK